MLAAWRARQSHLYGCHDASHLVAAPYPRCALQPLSTAAGPAGSRLPRPARQAARRCLWRSGRSAPRMLGAAPWLYNQTAARKIRKPPPSSSANALITGRIISDSSGHVSQYSIGALPIGSDQRSPPRNRTLPLTRQGGPGDRQGNVCTARGNRRDGVVNRGGEPRGRAVAVAPAYTR